MNSKIRKTTEEGQANKEGFMLNQWMDNPNESQPDMKVQSGTKDDPEENRGGVNYFLHPYSIAPFQAGPDPEEQASMRRATEKKKAAGETDAVVTREDEISALAASIVRKYPFPLNRLDRYEPYMNHIVSRKKIIQKDLENDDCYTFCSACGKKLYISGYDRYGDFNIKKAFKKCIDVVGEYVYDYQSFYFCCYRKGYEVIDEIKTIYDSYDDKVGLCKVTGTNLWGYADYSISEFLEHLYVDVKLLSYDNGMICGNGFIYPLIVHRELQRRLLKRLQVILKRMNAFIEAADKIEKHWASKWRPIEYGEWKASQ